MATLIRPESVGWCGHCHKQVATYRPLPQRRWHVLLSIFTLGVWAVVRLLWSARGRAWFCAECDHVTSRYG